MLARRSSMLSLARAADAEDDKELVLTQPLGVWNGTKYPKDRIPDGALADAQNIIPGTWKTRPGNRTKHLTAVLGTGGVKGAHSYQKHSGTPQVIYAINGVVYRDNNTVLESGLTNNNFEFTTYLDRVYYVNGDNSLRVYDGTTAAAITPYSPGAGEDANYLGDATNAIHDSRYIAVHEHVVYLAAPDAHPYRVYRSDELIGASYFHHYVDVVSGFGGKIVGLKPYRGSLVIFKTDSVWAADGQVGDATFRLRKLHGSIGCASGRTVVDVPALGLVFLGMDGHWYVLRPDHVNSENVPLYRLSSHIGDIVGGLNVSALSVACAHLSDNLYICCVPTGVSTANTKSYAFDSTRVESIDRDPTALWVPWSPYTMPDKASCFVQHRTGAAVYDLWGDASEGMLFRLNAGTNDGTRDTSGSFARSSTAYRSDGSLVASGQPRYEPGLFGQAILPEEATTNGFTSEQSRFVSGWTFTSSPEFTFEQNVGGEDKAVLTVVTTLTAGRVVEVQLSGAAADALRGQTRTFSLDAEIQGRSDGLLHLRLSDRDTATSTTEITNGASVAANGVHRMTVTRTLRNVGLNLVRFQCVATTGLNAGTTITLRLAQHEQKAYPTSWHIGGATRAIESLTVPTAGITPTGFCWRQWVYIGPVQRRQVAGQFPTILHIPRADNGVGIWLRHADNSANWALQTRNDADSATTSANVPDSHTPDGWHLFEVKVSLTEAKLFIDSVLRATIVNPNLPSAFAASAVVGNDTISSTVSNLNGLHDSIQILNYYPTDEESTAAYTPAQDLQWTDGTAALYRWDGDLLSKQPLPIDALFEMKNFGYGYSNRMKTQSTLHIMAKREAGETLLKSFVSVDDDAYSPLDTTDLNGADATWGAGAWGVGSWGAARQGYQSHRIYVNASGQQFQYKFQLATLDQAFDITEIRLRHTVGEVR